VDWVNTILDKFSWPLATVVLVIVLAIIFRRQVADLIARTTSIEIDPKKRQWRFKFGEQVRREQKKATMMPRPATAAGPVQTTPPAAGGAPATGRDIVLDAWGAVKQAVYDGCIANRVPVTPTLGVSDALHRVAEVRKLSGDLVEMVDLVYGLGREVAADSRLRPQDEDARAYRSLAYTAAYSLAESVLVPVDAPPQAPPRRPTSLPRRVPAVRAPCWLRWVDRSRASGTSWTSPTTGSDAIRAMTWWPPPTTACRATTARCATRTAVSFSTTRARSTGPISTSSA
jgi:hypothetical protein